MSSPKDYAPTKHDPIRLASVTLEAVDKIGAGAGDEIRQLAFQVMEGAEEIRDKLYQLADAIQGQCEIAHEHVSAFRDKTNHVLETIRALDLQGQPLPPAPQLDQNDPVPQFLIRGGNGSMAS